MSPVATRGQFTAFFSLLAGIVCLVMAAITTGIIAVGWTINWMVPSIRFDSACIVAGIACACTGFVLRGAAKSLIENGIFPRETADDDDDDEDDDDYIFDEEMADRIAELTVSKLSRPAPVKKYTAKARRQ